MKKKSTREHYEVGDVVFLLTDTTSAGWFERSGPFLVASVDTDHRYNQETVWLDLTNLDGSRCAKVLYGTDADADDCRKDVFLTAAHKANQCPSPSKS